MAKEQWETYFDAVRNEDWKTAKDVLLLISKEDKNNSQTFLKLGDVCQRSGDKSAAIAAYTHAAQLLRMQGFAQKALATYKIALRLDPDNPEIISRAEILMDEFEAAKTASHMPIPSLTPAVDAAEVLPVPPVDQPQKELPAPEPAIVPDEDGEWLESAYEALDTRMFKPEAERRPGAATSGNDDSINLISGQKPAKSAEELAEAMQEFLTPLSQRQERNIPEIFQDLPETMVTSFMNDLTTWKYRDKEHVIEEGDSGDSMFIIRSGKTRVVAHMLGRELELAVLGEGDVFGEVGFLTGRPRTAAVIADGPVEVYEISRLDIEKLIETNPEIIARIEDFYETRIRDTIRKIKS
jgi:CRP-like cAMP-binding protein